MSTEQPPPDETPDPMGEFDRLSPEFHAWVESMTPEQRFAALKRFYVTSGYPSYPLPEPAEPGPEAAAK
jgi:hypothetical protein